MTAPARECQPEADGLRQHTETPWELVEATEHHGAYITNSWGRTICDLYAMSNPMAASIRNGGDSYPVPFDDMEANAAFIVEAVNNHDTLLNNVAVMHKHMTGAAADIATLQARVAEQQKICDSYAEENQRFHDRIEELTKALETAKYYVDEAIASYDGDPPDNQFLRGHLDALKLVRDEAFSTGSMVPLEQEKSHG